MARRRSSASDVGAAFVAALGERDFARLAEVLAPDVRMRALVPPGPLEASGADEAAARFSAWFGNAEELDVLRAGSEDMGDRVHVSYRFRVKRPGESGTVIEQHLFCAIDDGRISALDLVCSGFRPIDEYSRAWRSPGRPVEAMAES
jgi:ketosteroid isomerase-like protein